MNKFILLCSFLFFFLSCSNDENETNTNQVTACFQISSEILEIGQELQITNCSTGASSYQFNFGNGITSTEESPVISFDNPGNYTITLKAISSSGEVKITSKNISVNQIFGNYIFTPVLEGDNIFPIHFGYAENTFYYIENYRNILINNSSKFNYVKVDLNTKNFTKTFLTDLDYNSGHASVSTLSNDNKIVYAVKSLSDRIGIAEINLNSNLETIATANYFYRVLYGTLQDGINYLYYGSYNDVNPIDPNLPQYKSPAIEIRNSLGEMSERKVYSLIDQGFIGDLKKIDNGFIAFGGVTEPTGFSTFVNYKPLVIFLDNDYDYVNHIAYSNTSISAINNNYLNGSFHIEKLSNGNYLLYSHNEFRIINNNGEEITKVNLPEQADTQDAISIENEGFIISSKYFLHKYDVNGNLIKSLNFNGLFTSNFIFKDNIIYFASAIDSSYNINGDSYSAIKTFIGAIDSDLNIINLN